jgi:hypothetical protein
MGKDGSMMQDSDSISLADEKRGKQVLVGSVLRIWFRES